jgi:hypothetical protein
VRLARALLLLSSATFAAIGIGYLAVPGAMLGIVGIDSTATTDFLLRTEGVVLVCAAIFTWAARDPRSAAARLVLAGLAIYYVLGSLVDLAAFVQGVLDPVSVPSAVVRIAVGILCAASVLRLSGAPDPEDGAEPGSRSSRPPMVRADDLARQSGGQWSRVGDPMVI